MSAIFETEFRDLVDADGNNTKASTAKSVLLALADHANDEGEGAYPGLAKMELKTALSRQCLINTYDALKYNGIILLEGTSKLGTNNYTINTQSFPKMEDGQPRLLVIPVTSTSQPGLPPLVNPVDPNHTLTTIKTPSRRKKFQDPVWDIMHGKTPSQEGLDLAALEETLTQIANRLSSGLRRGEFPQSREAQSVYRWIAEREAEGETLDRWLSWAMDGRRAEFSFIYHKDPSLIKRDWPQVFQGNTDYNPQRLDVGL